MNTEIILSNPVTIQAYFEKVRQLAAASEQYPVDLEDVWPLVYSEKVIAVRALHKNFFESEDYAVFDPNIENLDDALLDRKVKQKNARGGHNKVAYRLTVPCMEYFIARKVREVFDVYRQVFHRVADQLQQPATPDPLLLIAQMLQQQTQLLINNQQQVAQLREEVEYIKVTGQRPARLPRLPEAKTVSPPGQVRQALVGRVNEYANMHNATTREVWQYLYKRLFDVYGINPRRLKQLDGESMLSALERYGHLDRLDSLIRAELDYQDE